MEKSDDRPARTAGDGPRLGHDRRYRCARAGLVFTLALADGYLHCVSCGRPLQPSAPASTSVFRVPAAATADIAAAALSAIPERAQDRPD